MIQDVFKFQVFWGCKIAEQIRRSEVQNKTGKVVDT